MGFMKGKFKLYQHSLQPRQTPSLAHLPSWNLWWRRVFYIQNVLSPQTSFMILPTHLILSRWLGHILSAKKAKAVRHSYLLPQIYHAKLESLLFLPSFLLLQRTRPLFLPETNPSSVLGSPSHLNDFILVFISSLPHYHFISLYWIVLIVYEYAWESPILKISTP